MPERESGRRRSCLLEGEKEVGDRYSSGRKRTSLDQFVWEW